MPSLLCCRAISFGFGCLCDRSRRCSSGSRSRYDQSLVPQVAVGSDQTGRYVLVVNADNVVEQRKVQLGQTDGELQVVESGLKPEDRVVVSGILDAIPGQKVDPQLQLPKAAAAEPPTPK